MINEHKDKLKKMIDLYLAFKEEYHREPSYNEVYKGENLGDWLRRQKSSAQRGEMSIKRQDQLKNVGVDLFESAKEKRWNEACELYIEYVQKYGRGPYSNEVYKNVCLGQWVKQQRYRSETEKERLQQQYKMLLQKNGYTDDPLELHWQAMYRLCLKFIQKYNRMPKSNEVYLKKPLGNWFFYQNKLRKYNWLSDEHIKLLTLLETKISPTEEWEKSNGEWKISGKKWEKACLLYMEYLQKNGCGPVFNEMYKNVNLGQWVAVQRRRIKTEKELLQQQYQVVLAKNGYSEDPLELYWQEMYRLCREFVQINNRTPQNEEVYLDKPLGKWLAYQVKLMKYNWLSKDQYRLLTLLHI